MCFIQIQFEPVNMPKSLKRGQTKVHGKAACLTQKAEKDVPKTNKDRYVGSEACEASREGAAYLSTKASLSKKRKLKTERGEGKVSKKDNCKIMDEKASRTKCETLGNEEAAEELHQEQKLIENETKPSKERTKVNAKRGTKQNKSNTKQDDSEGTKKYADCLKVELHDTDRTGSGDYGDSLDRNQKYVGAHVSIAG